MGRIKVADLKIGESVIGELIDTQADMVKLKERDGETIARVSVPENIVEAIDEEFETDEIVEIVRKGKTSYEIFRHDDFPKEKEEGK